MQTLKVPVEFASKHILSIALRTRMFAAGVGEGLSAPYDFLPRIIGIAARKAVASGLGATLLTLNSDR